MVDRNKDKDELKDCPFCGGKAAIGEGSDHAYVTCVNCACATPVCASVEQAILVWNTRADGNSEIKLPDTPYNKLKKSMRVVIGMACALCKTKHCQPVQSVCSGIADAEEALSEQPRNCDVAKEFRDAACEYLSSHQCVEKSIPKWGWDEWYSFALWLFKKIEVKNGLT